MNCKIIREGHALLPSLRVIGNRLRNMTHRVALLAVSLLASLSLFLFDAASPAAALAWGVTFTRAVEEAALRQLSFAAEGLAQPGGYDDEETAAAPSAPAVAAEEAVQALAAAFETGDVYAARPAAAQVIRAAARPWQPLDAASIVDPLGASPGFHFRYETMLAAQVAMAAPVATARQARLIADVVDHMESIAAERAARAAGLAEADARAGTQAGGFYDATYYESLAADLGADLETALRGASETAADLIETAWERSGRGSREGAASKAVTLRVLAAGGGRVLVEFALGSSEPVTATLYSAAGRRVSTVHDGPLSAGFHRLAIPLAGPQGMAAGIYFLRLEAGEAMGVAKLPLLYRSHGHE